MATSLNDKMSKLDPARRAEIEARAADLIAEEMALRDLRRALRLTQEEIAGSLKIGQESVSRIEQRSDLRISTLRDYLGAMGGRLSLVAEFPDGRPVVLGGLANAEASRPRTEESAPSKGRTKSQACGTSTGSPKGKGTAK